MDNEYRRIYRSLYRREYSTAERPLLFLQRYRYLQYYRTIQRTIDEQCERVASDFPFRIDFREDALFFLATNLHQMVIVPVALRNRSHGELAHPPPILEFLRDDCYVILTQAVRDSSERPRNEQAVVVSGRIILATCAKVYDRLKVASENVWG